MVEGSPGMFERDSDQTTRSPLGPATGKTQEIPRWIDGWEVLVGRACSCAQRKLCSVICKK